MTTSARRLLALAALAAVGGAATAQAVAAPSGAARGQAQREGRATATRSKPRAKKKAKARAVKLSGSVAWAPTSALAAERAPLAGATRGAPSSGGAASSGTGAGGGSAGGTPTPTTTTTVPDAPPSQQALGATVDERTGYTLLLSRTTLTAGAVVVQLINKGEDPHNLRIVRTSPGGGAPTDLPEAGPQQQSAKTLGLTAGTYYLYCTLTTPTSHEAAGMHATLRVDP